MEINKKNEIDVTENNPIIEKNKVPQPEMKSGLQEKKKLKAEGTKAENVKEVVRGKSTHREVIQKIMDYAMSIGFDLCALDFSPIKGPEGNIEYLIHLKKSENEVGENLGGLDPVIVSDRAFETLAKQHA